MNKKSWLLLSISIATVGLGIGLTPTSSNASNFGGPTTPPEGTGCDEQAVVTSNSGVHANVALANSKILQVSGSRTYAAFTFNTDVIKGTKREPLSLAIVMDHSGSMSSEGKLVNAKSAAKGILEYLNEKDTVSLIKYDSVSQVVVPMVSMDAEGKQRLVRAIEGIHPAGGTNLGQGLQDGRDQLLAHVKSGQINRLMLLSDGLANEGITATPKLIDIAREAAQKGVRVTTIGLGIDYNEDLMEALAESGRGNYHYVRNSGALAGVFKKELESLKGTMASEVALRLKPCTGVEITDVFGYEYRRENGEVVIPMADLSSGDYRKVVVELSANAKKAGAMSLVHGTLGYHSNMSKAPGKVFLVANAIVTPEQKEVDESSDASVAAKVIEVRSARQMREAAKQYAKGDQSGAVRILDRLKRENMAFGSSYGVSASEMKAMDEEASEQAKDYASAAPTTSAGRAALKKNKVASRKYAK